MESTADIHPAAEGVVVIDPARLASGTWCPRQEKTLGEGDIQGSYSADRVGMGQPVRKPFNWQGSSWLCTGTIRQNGTMTAEAYRLVPASLFKGAPTTYQAKTRDGDAARSDPLGFYHGMTVRSGSTRMVLAGPPVCFAPGKAVEQLALF